jgi:hypothetical protein
MLANAGQLMLARVIQSSMHHPNWYSGVTNHVSRHPAEDLLMNPSVGEGTHDDKIRSSGF